MNRDDLKRIKGILRRIIKRGNTNYFLDTRTFILEVWNINPIPIPRIIRNRVPSKILEQVEIVINLFSEGTVLFISSIVSEVTKTVISL